MDRFAEELRPSGIEFQIRVGINTGEVVVRDAATGGVTRDSRIYGDTLNVAARMQSEAPPGGIMITGETYGRVSGAIESRHVGPVSVKGKAEPVEAYEVIGRTGVLRSVRGISGLSSPMVGRDDELARLVAALTPVRGRARQDGPRGGRAGIGKSRLLAELRRVAEADGFRWVRGPDGLLRAKSAAAPGDRSGPLAHRPARSAESIPADEASDLLAERLADLAGPDDAGSATILGHLLSLPPDEAGAERTRAHGAADPSASVRRGGLEPRCGHGAERATGHGL